MAIEDAAVRSAVLGLTSARKQVDDVGRATAALASQAEHADATSRQAITASRTAIDQARLASATISTTLAQVRSISRQSAQQLQAAQTVARQAAAKAGVYHIPSSALAEIRSTLLAAPTGKSAIGCSAGLEAACHDLIQAFTDGGWPPSFNYAASFWSGYDAVGPDNDPNTGVEVWYSKPSGELIAKRIAAILSIAGLHTATSRRPSDPFDLGISLRFITP
jgi:hypothetical protein